MLKKLSIKTNFILIGIVVGLFIGVSIRQAFGQEETSGTARADNLTVNMSANAGNGLIVASGNALIAEGNVGIGTLSPTAKLDVAGDIRSTTQLCAGATCVTENELQIMKSQSQLGQVKTLLSTETDNSSLTITTTSIPDATVGTPYTFTFASTGGTAFIWNLNPYNTRADIGGLEWSNVDDSSRRPNGLGVIRGTPITAGTYRFTVTVNGSVSKEFTLVIKPQGSTQSPPSSTTCTGNHPVVVEGNGVVLSPYTTVSAGGGGTSSPNTEWKYGEASCGWGCMAPMERNGDIGCKAPVAGSGVTVTINNLSAGQPFSGVNVLPVSVIGLTTTAALGMNGENSGIFTTGTDGKTAEFKLGYMDLVGSWTQMEIKSPGYKIRSANGCTAKVSIYANRQLNQCPGAVNGKSVTINMVPGDISTLPNTHFETLTYHRGETLKGSITGGDPHDTWGCMDTPSTASDRLCNSGRTDAWRKLTVPYDGHADGWHLVETNQGDRIELGGLLIEQGFPLGTYTQYVKTGQWGTPGQTTSKSITVQ